MSKRHRGSQWRRRSQQRRLLLLCCSAAALLLLLLLLLLSLAGASFFEGKSVDGKTILEFASLQPASQVQAAASKDMWDDGSFDTLVSGCEKLMTARMSSLRGDLDDKEVLRRFDQLVKNGEIRSAARFLTERLDGGVKLPDEIDEKSGKPVLEVLRDKHPAVHDPDYDRLRKVFPGSAPVDSRRPRVPNSPTTQLPQCNSVIAEY